MMEKGTPVPIELDGGEDEEGVGDEHAGHHCAVVLARKALDPQHLQNYYCVNN
jgi:hypothetical protein